MGAALAALGQGISSTGNTIGSTIFSSKRANFQAKKARQLFYNQTQIRVRDLRAAGINPILASGLGGGGSVPAGRSHGATTSGGDIGASSALQAIRQQKELKILEEQARKNKAEADTAEIFNTRELMRQFWLTGGSVGGKANPSWWDGSNAFRMWDAERDVAALGGASARNALKIEEGELGEGLKWLQRILPMITGATSAAGSARKALGK